MPRPRAKQVKADNKIDLLKKENADLKRQLVDRQKEISRDLIKIDRKINILAKVVFNFVGLEKSQWNTSGFWD